MTDHDHLWWHYWVIPEGQGLRKVYEDPYEPVPEFFFSQGYACFCGVSRLSDPRQAPSTSTNAI